MNSGEYLRYVALGDSQTEGLGDGDDIIGLRGWADRLAERLAAVNPSLAYANLAVRGRVAGQVRTEQLGRPWPCAPTWRPSSPGSTTCSGPGSTPRRWPGIWKRCSPRSQPPGPTW